MKFEDLIMIISYTVYELKTKYKFCVKANDVTKIFIIIQTFLLVTFYQFICSVTCFNYKEILINIKSVNIKI